MGFSFNGDGRYVGWSSLFDLTSINTLIASEKLPQPKGRKYKFKNGAINIDEYLKDIILAEEQINEDPTDKSRVDRINAYNRLIRKLNTIEKLENGVYLVSWTLDGGRKILDVVETHETSKIPKSLLEDADKNFISSHIQYTILNLRNMIGAYSPITINDLKRVADDTPKGRLSASITMLNPAAKMIMLRLNIVGKDVIGIAANGEKVSFMWHYWINDTIAKAKESEDLKYIKFSFTTSRVFRRFANKGLHGETIEINTLPEVNLENLSNKAIGIFLNNKLTGDITVDLMISLLLSAATDFRKQQ